MPSMRPSRRAAPDVRSAMKSAGGGCTFAAAPHAATSGAATTPLRGTPRHTGAPPGIRSSGLSNPVRTGSGITTPTSITTDRNSPRPNAIQKTSPLQDRPIAFPKTGWPSFGVAPTELGIRTGMSEKNPDKPDTTETDAGPKGADDDVESDPARGGE